MIKNITTIECFGVFLQMRAFAEIESRFAAARVVLHQRRTADAAATLARIQGEMFPTEVARPMSRPQICERRKLRLPPPWPDWRFDSRHRGTVSLDASSHPDVCGLTGPLRCAVRETSLSRPRKPVRKMVAGPAGQMPGPLHATSVADHSLFASLILRRVRAQDSSAGDPEQPDWFSDDPKLGPVSAAASTVVSALMSRPATTAATASPNSAMARLETHLAELAWRRVRGLAAEDTAK